MADSTFELSDENELTINWTIQTTLIQFCSLSIVKIELRYENDCEDTFKCVHTAENVPITNKTYKFSENLEACGAYEYKIYNSFDIETAKITRQVKANPRYQSFELKAEESEDSSSLTVSWNYTQFPLCPRTFLTEVYQNDALIRSLTVSNKLNVTIDNLEPCEKYNIIVTPMNEADRKTAYASTITQTMGHIIPTGIKDLTLVYNAEEISIDINWIAPDKGSKCIFTYEARIESDYDNRMTTSEYPTQRFSNMLACVVYKVQVSAITINQMKSAPIVKSIQIPSRGKIFNHLGHYTANLKAKLQIQFLRHLQSQDWLT